MRFTSFFIVAFIGVAAFSSCNKDKDTIARIRVYNTSNQPVEGAVVKLVPRPGSAGVGVKPTVGEKTAVTNSSGVATFDFTPEFRPGQAGVAVLDIDVNTSGKKGIIKVVEETVTEERVVI